jgi:hypothetical protein
MTSFRQVSWLAGLRPSPPSRALQKKPSGIREKDSSPTVAGAAPELSCRQTGETHRIPSWPINGTGAPELPELNEPFRRVSSNPVSFCRKVLHSRNATSAQSGERNFAAPPSKKTLSNACIEVAFTQLKQAGSDFCCTAAEQQNTASRKMRRHAYLLESDQIKLEDENHSNWLRRRTTGCREIPARSRQSTVPDWSAPRRATKRHAALDRESIRRLAALPACRAAKR